MASALASRVLASASRVLASLTSLVRSQKAHEEALAQLEIDQQEGTKHKAYLKFILKLGNIQAYKSYRNC